MKLGLLTAALPDLTLEQIAAWAAAEGFESLEVERRPGGEAERPSYAAARPDWPRFVAALYAVGYDRFVSIEHEDREFEGDEELVKRGFFLARNTLRPLLV